jgi:putative oxidoreductase
MLAKLSSIKRLFDKLTELEWLWIFVARVGVGCEFCLSGWGKLHKLHEFTAYFAQLGIPAPSIQAPFVAALECFGGLLLMLGLGTRIFGLMLGFTMIVAMATAIDLAGKGLSDFLYLPEWLLLLLLFWLVFSGGGKLSIDALIAKRMTPPAKTAAKAA